ncbi:MAG: PQQ-dependent sugar dehydrogenase [Pseudomonadota bacterium]
MRRLILALAAVTAIAGPALALDSSAGTIRVERVAGDLEEPWGLAFLPDGGFLVTLRDGDLVHIRENGSRQRIRGVPDVQSRGQGGLLDVAVARDFAETNEIFLTFARPQRRGEGTALAIAELNTDAGRLRNVRVIFEMAPGSSGGRHFGSRVVEALDGTLYVTTGDRGDRPSAQDLSNHNGAVIRVTRSGQVPPDNPFVGQSGARPEIWSYGHRNPQGATLDLNGNLWTVEHGAQGGDEINRIRRGANYGWPVISYGRHYSGAKIGEGTARDGMEQPALYWDPSIAPSGMMVYSGGLWPEWAGDMFVGSLKFGMISRVDGDSLREVERLESNETERVRDIREAPDGSIWFLSVGQGAVFRMVPGSGT